MPVAGTDPLRVALDAYQNGDPATCVETLDRCRDVWTARPDGWLIRGAAARAMGRIAEAETAYREAIRLYPAYPEAWQNLGNLYAGTGRHDAAIEAYGHAVAGRQDPREKAMLLSVLAGSAFSVHRVDLALNALEQAVAFDATLGAVHNQRGKVLWELGHTDAAIDAFRRAVECDPEDALFATNYLLVSQFSTRFDESDLSSLARATALRIAHGVPDTLGKRFEAAFPAPGSGSASVICRRISGRPRPGSSSRASSTVTIVPASKCGHSRPRRATTRSVTGCASAWTTGRT